VCCAGDWHAIGTSYRIARWMAGEVCCFWRVASCAQGRIIQTEMKRQLHSENWNAALQLPSPKTQAGAGEGQQASLDSGKLSTLSNVPDPC
jgi:hypothetical protein